MGVIRESREVMNVIKMLVVGGRKVLLGGG